MISGHLGTAVLATTVVLGVRFNKSFLWNSDTASESQEMCKKLLHHDGGFINLIINLL